MNRLVLLFPLLAALSAGCYADAGVRPVAVHSEVAYAPLYFDDSVVYFDDVGMPYYYDAGVVVYVPHGDARFRMYVDHYREHHEAYRHWAAHAEQRHFRHGGAVAAHARVNTRRH